jgi:hypothetical protein
VTLSATKPVYIDIGPPPAGQVAQTLAHSRARDNFAANITALSERQSSVVRDLNLPGDGEWVFGRDGALTIRDGDKWWTGCSVPRRAAARALRTLDAGGALACFPAPQHPAYIAEALAILRPNQAVLAILPEKDAMPRFLACEDFSAAITANRLWFIFGEDWPRQVEEFMLANPGMPIPQNFIRAPATGAARFDPMVDPAQQAFSRVTATRAAELESILAMPRTSDARNPRQSRELLISDARPDGGLCIVAGSHFRLWDDAGLVLAETLDCRGEDLLSARVEDPSPQPSRRPGDSSTRLPGEGENPAIVRVDIDDPLRAGPLAVAEAAATCDALIAADLGRADLPGIVRDELVWISWITRPRCLAAAGAGPRDRLLLADAALEPLARAAGWPSDRIAVAAWPLPNLPASEGVHPGITLIADIGPTGADDAGHAGGPPKVLDEFSSHRLLWEAIADELSKNPFAAGDDARAYLARWANRAGVNAADLPEAMFVEKLVLPASHAGLARILAADDIPLRLAGAGWNDLPDLARFAVGPINTRAQLLRLVASSAALLDGWPGRVGHPVRRMGRPILNAISCGPAAFVRQARALLGGEDKYQPDRPAVAPPVPVLSAAILSDILAG